MCSYIRATFLPETGGTHLYNFPEVYPYTAESSVVIVSILLFAGNLMTFRQLSQTKTTPVSVRAATKTVVAAIFSI